MRNRLIGGGLLLLGVTCLATYLSLSYWVERPVAKLTSLVDNMRSRQTTPADSRRSGDEIAQLQTSFESMLAEIGEKTEALLEAERDLAHSQRLASIGLLAAGIAHEIGSPLSTIQLQAGFWEERSGGPVRTAAGAIARAAKQVGVLQRELLTFDRREALHLARCDLRSVARECLTLAERPGLVCELDFPDEPLMVAADRTLLTRALGNILDNAARAMGGNGTLMVTLRRAEGNRAEVAIRDTGPGIPDEDLPHVFEPFFTGKQEARGSGLGLAIAREIVVRHGGEITAETTPAGACFRILLPLKLEEKDDGAHLDRRR